MKATHRPDIFTFAVFDNARNLDFNGYLLVREGGNVLVDPVTMSAHDRAHLQQLGGAAWVVLTNSDHRRDGAAIADACGAKLAGPAAERDSLGLACDQWLSGGDAWRPGIEVVALAGSKTPGELALIVDGNTLITGDLVRGHVGGWLNMLPDPKLADREAAVASVRKLAQRSSIQAVLVGDGWPVFRDGHARLAELVADLA
jgi:hypothetical protein